MTVIAEIWPDYGRLDDVTVSDDDRRLVLTTAYAERAPGYADFEYVLTVVELSQNREWAIVIKEPASPGTGRVSSQYAVIHPPHRPRQDRRDLRPDGGRRTERPAFRLRGTGLYHVRDLRGVHDRRDSPSHLQISLLTRPPQRLRSSRRQRVVGAGSSCSAQATCSTSIVRQPVLGVCPASSRKRS